MHLYKSPWCMSKVPWYFHLILLLFHSSFCKVFLAVSFSSPFYGTVSFSGWSWVLDNQRLAQLQLQSDLQWRGDPGCGERSKWGLALICQPSIFVLCLAGTMWTDDLEERECVAVFRGSHLGTIAFAYAHCSCGIVLANLPYTFFFSKYSLIS